MTHEASSAQERARWLVREHGTTFAEDAGITLRDEPMPLWQLLVLTQLLSTRISSDVAVRTARELWDAGWRTPARMRESTWRSRVTALGRGGYRRYDESTATRLGANADLVQERWGDDLRHLRDEADGDPRGIARCLQECDGIGPTGAAIFLREASAVWPCVGLHLDERARSGARLAGLPAADEALVDLVDADDVPRLLAALVRIGRRPSLLDGSPLDAR